MTRHELLEKISADNSIGMHSPENKNLFLVIDFCLAIKIDFVLL